MVAENNQNVSFQQYKKQSLGNDPELQNAYDDLEMKYHLIEQIAKLRKAENMTQQELAEKLGIAQSSIGRLESNKQNPTLSFINKIANALGYNMHITFTKK